MRPRKGFGRQRLGHPVDLPGPGKEDEDVARLLTQRLVHGRHHGGIEAVLRPPGQPAVLDGEHPTRARHHRHGRSARPDGAGDGVGDWVGTGVGRTFDQRRHPLPVQGRGHHEEPQIGTKGAPDVERQGQAQVPLEVAFVELVEDDQTDACQFGIVLQAAGQHPFGHHFDAGAMARTALVPGPEADQPTDLVTEEIGHAARRGPGGQTTGFEHHDPGAAQPGFVHQPKRDDGGLAGARFGLEHRGAAGRQGRPELIDARLDR